MSRHVEYAANATDSIDDTGILLLGDSADRNLIFDFCSAAGHEVRAFLLFVPRAPTWACTHPHRVMYGVRLLSMMQALLPTPACCTSAVQH